MNTIGKIVLVFNVLCLAFYVPSWANPNATPDLDWGLILILSHLTALTQGANWAREAEDKRQATARKYRARAKHGRGLN